jgi:tetratricopeptide (TPR) repeat protein
MTEVARQLGVDGVIEGSVFRSGDQIRVTVQLIHGATDGHVWAESYEGSTDDAIGLQRRVAEAIARSLEITLSADEQARLSAASAVSSEAQEAFFRGIHRTRYFTALSVQTAIEDYHRAAALEPTWAAAAGMLGQSYWILTQPLSALPASEGMPLARQWATRAVELDPDLGIGHSSLGWVSLFYDRDLEVAEGLFDRAVETWPGSGVGYNGRSFVLAIRGESEDAVAQGKRAVAVDRLDLSFRTALAELYYYDRRYDQALAELDSVLGVDPRYARAFTVRRWVLEAQELWADAADALAVDIALSSGAEPVPTPSLDSRESYWGWRLELLTEDALDSVADPTLLAWAHAESGDADRALEYLDRAVAAGSGQLVFLGIQPAWDRIRVDPRFVELLTRLGIPTV